MWAICFPPKQKKSLIPFFLLGSCGCGGSWVEKSRLNYLPEIRPFWCEESVGRTRSSGVVGTWAGHHWHVCLNLTSTICVRASDGRAIFCPAPNGQWDWDNNGGSKGGERQRQWTTPSAGHGRVTRMDGSWAVPANGAIEWVHNVMNTLEQMYYVLLFPEYHHSFLSTTLSKSIDFFPFPKKPREISPSRIILRRSGTKKTSERSLTKSGAAKIGFLVKSILAAR